MFYFLAIKQLADAGKGRSMWVEGISILTTHLNIKPIGIIRKKVRLISPYIDFNES